MTNVHIVIPVYNQWELCHDLLWKLQKIEGKNITSIHLINDCSMEEGVADGMKWWASSYGSKFPIYAVHNQENMGFLKTANFGIRRMVDVYATHATDIVILMSTDVKVSGPFIQQIKDILETKSINSLVGGVVYTHDTGWNKFGNKIFPYAEGWLLATTAENWKELGGFDEIYAPCDFEDVDLSTKAIGLGYQLAPLNNPGLAHLGGRSIGYSEDRLRQTKINQKKFEEKWIK